MATLTLHKRLRERAARNRRSLDEEALACLKAALTEDTKTLLTRIRDRRARLGPAGRNRRLPCANP